MGIGEFARKAWDVFTLSNQSAPFTFAQSYTPVDDLWREMFMGGAAGPVTREQLLSVPAAMRARDMICNIATLPLVEIDTANRRTSSPLFDQFDPQVPNVVHLTQTVEDLFADGISWWEITEQDGDRYPVKVRRRSDANVSLNPPDNTTRGQDILPGGYDPRDGSVWVDGRQVAAARMIRFDSPKAAARKVMAGTLRRATALDEAATMYAKDPRPADYFTPRQGMPDPASDTEIAGFLRKWREWRRKQSTGYVPYAMDYNVVDVPTPVDLQLVQLQERVSLDLAIAFGLDPSDVGVPVQSMTYANVTDKRQDRINDVLAYFIRAIVDRLKMDDVTRAGHRPMFDLDDYLRPDPKTRAEVAQIYAAMGVVGPDWVAKQEGLPPEARSGARPAAVDQGPPDNVRQLPQRVAAARFAAEGRESVTLDVEVTGFAADEGRRRISGTAVPYGLDKIARKGGRRYRFLPGSLTWSQESRVKFLEDHNSALAFGSMLELVDTPTGLQFVGSVAPGDHGDRMLSLAANKVKDGLSIGVEFFDDGMTADPHNPGVILVHRAQLLEVSLTAMPTFDDARVTRVAAMRDPEGTLMPCQLCGQIHAEGVACPTPAPPTGPPAAAAPAADVVPAGTTGASFTADQVMAFMRAMNPTMPAAPAAPAAAPVRPTINPEGAGDGGRATFVREELPYRFGRKDNNGGFTFAGGQPHEFHRDLLTMARSGDDGTEPRSDAARRVMGFVRATFDVDSADVNELNPTINRPDMYVDKRDFRRPIWQLIGRGAPPNGVQPFMFPKWLSETGLVAAHTEGTEPDSGGLVVTNQTVQPAALSGKASLTREVWDMGGNPATSALIFNRMRQAYFKALEVAAAAHLATLTAATDINLNTGATATAAPTSAQLDSNWRAALSGLQFVEDYDFSAFVIEQNLYQAFVAANDTAGRPLYPIINPMNANGTARTRFQTLDLGGVEGIPSWALTHTAGSVNSSWLFDPEVVYGWATPPQRLEFPGTDSTGEYAPVAMIDIAIWGYDAFATTDIGGVRQVTYDTTT
jgi:HK97 family phage prohead protease